MEFYIDPIAFVAQKSGFESRYVRNLLGLLDEGATIPFISRYRKEMTGSMDEVQVGLGREIYEQFKELEKRKKTVLESIEQQDKLTPELKGQIEKCTDARVLEDIYLPYKPKKQTRASKAKAKGLEPLAAILMRQEHGDVWTKAARFVKGDVEGEDDALQGARDIIAEWVSENERARNSVRRFFDRVAVVKAKVVKGKEAEGEKFTDYFDYSEPLRRVPSHRMLAIRRGEAEGILKVAIEIPDDEAVESLERIFVKARNDSAEQVAVAVKDGYKRLLLSSIETEYLQTGKQKPTRKLQGVCRELAAIIVSPAVRQ